LAGLSSEQIQRAIFPLGSLVRTKKETRWLSSSLGLRAISEKATSTGICFVQSKIKFSAWLDELVPPYPHEHPKTLVIDGDSGRTIDDVEVVGEPPVIPAHHITVGQRVMLRSTVGPHVGEYRRWYVSKKIVESSVSTCSVPLRGITVVPVFNHPHLRFHTFVIRQLCRHIPIEITSETFVTTRHHDTIDPCTVVPVNPESWKITLQGFEKRAGLAGQLAVIYVRPSNCGGFCRFSPEDLVVAQSGWITEILH
jgi:tRNA U34 2-thiouridine synthase MnmA/TrmU